MGATAADQWLFIAVMVISAATILVLLKMSLERGRRQPPAAEPLGSPVERSLAASLVRGELSAIEYHMLVDEVSGHIRHDR